jgi:DNA-binding transcriptional LysR family regulator
VPLLPRLTRRVSALWRTDAARRPAIRAAVEALRAAAAQDGRAVRSGASAG